MTDLLKGKPFADSIVDDLIHRSDLLKNEDIYPTLAVVRMGENPDDLAYERGLKKRAVSTGVLVKVHALPEDAGQKAVEDLIGELNNDDRIHGVLVFEPLPAHIDTERIHKRLTPAKDIDGVTSGSMATVYSGKGKGFAPCTAEASVGLLKHYGIELKGANVAVMGRSTVIGKPVSMLLLEENATVTMCHSKTKDAASICRNADIIIACIGKGKYIGSSFLRDGQVIVDVGINFDEEGNMMGDVDFEAAERAGVKAITPVPGGVGAATTAILMKHVIEAAEKIHSN